MCWSNPNKLSELNRRTQAPQSGFCFSANSLAEAAVSGDTCGVFTSGQEFSLQGQRTRESVGQQTQLHEIFAGPGASGMMFIRHPFEVMKRFER